MADFKSHGYIVFLPLIVLLWGVFMVQTTFAKQIMVGGQGQGWRYGFNYAEWASKAGPFEANDTLVFVFPPTKPDSIFHNVYLLKNKIHYKKCNISGGSLLTDSTKANGKPFSFKLRSKAHHYYFACGVDNGTHCDLGLMKFGVTVQA